MAVAEIESHPDISADPLGNVCAEDVLLRLLSELPVNQRAVFILFCREELSCEVMGQRLGLSPHTVKKYLTRAIATLRAADWR
jgi:RNA polymerase sigma-70 factor (ECF subfamily)